MFSFFSKKWKASPLNLTDIAKTTLVHRERLGWAYRDGVVEEAVRRATDAEGTEAVIDAIESAFIDYELGPRLCGFVGNG